MTPGAEQLGDKGLVVEVAELAWFLEVAHTLLALVHTSVEAGSGVSYATGEKLDKGKLVSISASQES